jgi:hypothetical protein
MRSFVDFNNISGPPVAAYACSCGASVLSCLGSLPMMNIVGIWMALAARVISLSSWKKKGGAREITALILGSCSEVGEIRFCASS